MAAAKRHALLLDGTRLQSIGRPGGRTGLRWQEERGVEWHDTASGKPIENAIVDGLNGRFRDECLNEHRA